jgi:hypothetical protein
MAIANCRLEEGDRKIDGPDQRRYLHRDRPVRPLEEEREDKNIERAANQRIYGAMVRALRPLTWDLPAGRRAGKRDCIRSDSRGRSLNLRRWCHLAKKLSQSREDPRYVVVRNMSRIPYDTVGISLISWFQRPQLPIE